MANPQFDAARRARHMLTPEGWSRAALWALFDRADDACLPASSTGVLPGLRVMALLYGAPAAGRFALEAAAAQCEWTVLPPPRALDVEHDTPVAMASLCDQADVVVMSHVASGAAHALARHLPADVPIVNIVDGMHAAPLAALADVAALRHRLPDLHTRSLALCGDLLCNARLRTVIHMLTTLGVPKVNVVHPDNALPEGAAQLGVHVFTASTSAAAFEGVDAILRFPPDSVPGTLSGGNLEQPLLIHGAPDRMPANDAQALDSTEGLTVPTPFVSAQARMLRAVVATLKDQH